MNRWISDSLHGVVVVVVEIWQRRHANPPAGSDAIKLGEIQSNSIGDFDGYVSFNIDGIEGRGWVGVGGG